MNKQPASRLRARYWMSGGLAVVLAALGGNAFAADERLSAISSSRYDILETANRIEASALRHGLSVFTRMRQSPIVGMDGARLALVIVLSSSQGGTPVVMDGVSERPGLPLSVMLRAGLGGVTQVYTPVGEWGEFPGQLAEDVAGLSESIADALG